MALSNENYGTGISMTIAFGNIIYFVSGLIVGSFFLGLTLLILQERDFRKWKKNGMKIVPASRNEREETFLVTYTK